MLTSGERRAALIALAVLGCVGAGAAAGLDAGRHVDALYTTPPAPRWQAAAVTPAPAPAPDVAVAADYPVAAPAQPAWAKEADADERAYFDTDIPDEWRDDAPPPVRVHRAALVRDDGPALDAAPVPGAGMADGAGDGGDPVAPDQGSDPDRLP